MALKAGTESKKKVIVAAVLGLVVLALIVWDIDRVFLSSPTPSTAEQQVTGNTTEANNSGQNAQQVAVQLSQLDPTLHPELMAAAESLPYVGSGRNIFSMNSAPVVPIEPVRGPVRPYGGRSPMTQVATGPPPPPSIDIQFFGYSLQNGVRKAFLLHGNNIFIASNGEVVDHHYRVLEILPFSIEIRDLLNNNTQSIPLIRR